MYLIVYLNLLSLFLLGYSTSDTNCVDETEEICNQGSTEEDTHLAKLVAKFDRSIEALWNTDDACIEENNMNEYQGLPVDIQELLASPKHEVEFMNAANKRIVNNNKGFIQCGTNITSSIWSDYNNVDEENNEKSLYDSYCNLYNEALETNTDKLLGDQFNYLSVGMDKINDLFVDKSVAENETNALYENFGENNNKNDFTSLPWELSYPIDKMAKKWSDGESYSLMGDLKFGSPLNGVAFKRNVNKAVNESLLTLNHSEEESCFKEVVPKQVNKILRNFI